MYLSGLNDKQLEAVTATEGYLRVIAGAGSGKTKLLVSRYAYLVKEYGIEPAQFAYVKAFMGDTSDGYPGVKGIGPKTALKLIQQFGSIEGVLEALPTLKAGQRIKIGENQDMLNINLKREYLLRFY